jgi:hypothetical protein
MTNRVQLEQSIVALESQRAILGDAEATQGLLMKSLDMMKEKQLGYV